MLIGNSFPQFGDLGGVPLDAGYIYFGVVSQNPETTPISVYWDAAMTQPAYQPLRTINGYIVRDGIISNLYINDKYSITVRDSKSNLIYSLPDSTYFDQGAISSNLAVLLASGSGASMIGSKDACTGSVLVTLDKKLAELETPIGFGAKADGTTNDTLAATNFIACTNGKSRFPKGNYLLDTITLSNNGNIEIYGDGIDETIFTSGTISNSAGVFLVDSGSAVTQVENLYFHDFTLEGNVATLAFSQFIHLLSLNGVKNVIIERVKFNGFRGDGLYIGSGTAAGIERHNTNVTVRDCIFNGVNNDNRNGISIIDCNVFLAENNKFLNCTRSTMPGAIDIEPDSSAYHIVANINISKNKFENIGGNTGVISVYLPAAVNQIPANIVVEKNTSNAYVGSGNFFNFNTNRLPTATSIENNVQLIGNTANTGVNAFSFYDGKRITIRDNNFTDFTQTSLLGFNGATNAVRDIELENNRFVRNGSVGGNGISIFTATYIHFQSNKFIDCGTGGVGTSNAIDFNTGTSSDVKFDNNQWSSPTGKTLIAIQKEAGHAFTVKTNRFIGNDFATLSNNFVSEESDVLEQSYLPVIVGSGAGGAGVYPIQYGLYRRMGKTVFFRIQLSTNAGHTGTGQVQVSLPLQPKPSANNELRSIPASIDGCASTGGQIGQINPAAVAGGVTGAIRYFQTQTGVHSAILMPAGAFVAYAAGTYEML